MTTAAAPDVSFLALRVKNNLRKTGEMFLADYSLPLPLDAKRYSLPALHLFTISCAFWRVDFNVRFAACRSSALKLNIKIEDEFGQVRHLPPVQASRPAANTTTKRARPAAGPVRARCPARLESASQTCEPPSSPH